jgi:signal transduction histidine kinase/HAMP domain-containing protein
MSAKTAPVRSMSITLRTALWSWLVTLLTLLIFAAAIIPQQKQTFQENLESKAHGVAISLRDVAAGAVVNEDFSSVVDHCEEMLKGDSALEYLIVTKNDGFSIICDRTGWRSEPKAGVEWRPAQRVKNSGIGTVPIFERRVFHYSQPFDYSGIEWGWIHVGLSLESYDRSVTSVYWRTSVLAVCCVVLSFAASGLYASKLVKPILNLRTLVQKVAGGDLSARAEVQRHDEIGVLATSVNTMTEALLRRDRILESVRFAAQRFLGAREWQTVMPSVLAKIGEATGVCKAYVFENHPDGAGPILACRRHEWSAKQAALPALKAISSQLPREGLERWASELEKGRIVCGLTAQMPPGERRLFEDNGARSFVMIPIHVENIWWGFLGLEDCLQDRVWTDSERDSLQAAADMLGATIARQNAQNALIEAKETLEQRVKERTKELQEQVVAKDRAHADLAQAQRQLMDASRIAGMAEIATGVLHNVGNVLNSVNVSVTLLSDQVNHSQSVALSQLCGLLEKHREDLGSFLNNDPKGRQVPDFLSSLASALEEERFMNVRELTGLRKNVDHIKEIVAMQQSYATVGGLIEDLPAASLVEDAIKINEGAFRRHQIEVNCQFDEVPLVRVDKHRVLQILVNLLRNAKYALKTSDRQDKLLTLGIGRNGSGRVKIIVKDNGIGIEPVNLTKIFQHGFTTKKEGHGFGLHSGALAAKEMGGSLLAFSEGHGLGASFVLELPTAESNAASPV